MFFHPYFNSTQNSNCLYSSSKSKKLSTKNISYKVLVIILNFRDILVKLFYNFQGGDFVIENQHLSHIKRQSHIMIIQNLTTMKTVKVLKLINE